MNSQNNIRERKDSNINMPNKPANRKKFHPENFSSQNLQKNQDLSPTNSSEISRED